MNIRHGYEERSRLGRLLVNRGYLSPGQLEEGLALQDGSGRQLGQVFIDAGWITEKELNRVLKHQSRYRNAAALMAVVALPFQPMVSFAANGSASQPTEDAAEMVQRGRLVPLTEDELSQVAGQGDSALLSQIASVTEMTDRAAEAGEGEAPVDVVEGIRLTANIFVPILNFLDSDLTISGVHYRPGAPRFELRDDGGLTLAFPERIEQIRMDNIRVSGSQSPAMGNVSIHDIRFHPDSRMTIYTR